MSDQVVSIPVEPPFDQIGAAAFMSVLAYPIPIQFSRQACSPIKSNRPDGTMVTEEHSVRGFLAATVKKMPGVTLLSEKSEDGPRRYRIEAAGE